MQPAAATALVGIGLTAGTLVTYLGRAVAILRQIDRDATLTVENLVAIDDAMRTAAAPMGDITRELDELAKRLHHRARPERAPPTA